MGHAAKGRVDEEICRRDLPITVGRKPRRFWSARPLVMLPHPVSPRLLKLTRMGRRRISWLSFKARATSISKLIPKEQATRWISS